MPVEPDPETISWPDAVAKVPGVDNPTGAATRLLDAVAGGSVGYRPLVAVSIESKFKEGLLDIKTGALRMNPRDSRPRYLRIVVSDFERHFLRSRDERRVMWDGYTPDYVALILRAIKQFNISDENQPLAKTLRDWFEGQEVAGEKISENLAKAMTTIVRLPERKKGGAVPRQSKG
jgi:hypothetical protein